MNPLLRSLPTDRLPHGWQVLATLLAVASAFTLCWWLTKLGLIDLAATAASFYALTLVRQIAPSLAARAPVELKATATLIDTARADLAAWMASRRLLSHAIIAAVVTVSYLALRAIASTTLHLIASPWLALAVGLAVAAAITSPVLVKNFADALTARRDDTPTPASEEPR